MARDYKSLYTKRPDCKSARTVVCTSIAACFSHDADCARSLNPCLNRQNKVVATCSIPNCIEFGTIKNRVIQHLPFTEIFNSTLQACLSVESIFYLSFNILPSKVSLYQYLVNGNISYSGRLSKYSNSNTRRGSSSFDSG